VEYHRKSTHGTREFLPDEAIIPEMLAIGAVDSAMKSKTKSSVLRDLVALAEKTGQVTDARELLESLETREELCSTALPGGLAIPHPRFHQPYLFESSFIVVGRPIQKIHFGAPDGQPTDLIFLLCCQDDRIHLHTLSRLCMMALKTEMLSQLRAASGNILRVFLDHAVGGELRHERHHRAADALDPFARNAAARRG
jgi:nitrogen PTS system EIIA component